MFLEKHSGTSVMDLLFFCLVTRQKKYIGEIHGGSSYKNAFLEIDVSISRYIVNINKNK